MIDPTGSSHDRYGAEAIADELVDLVQCWHDQLNLFSPSSVVSMINHTPRGTPMRVDREMFELLRLCACLCQETNGAFNIAAGTLMHIHGFRDRRIESSAANGVHWNEALMLDEKTKSIARKHDCVQIDLGGIAKGFVLDLIRDELRSYGIERGFVHGGSSSVLGHGENSNEKPWQIAIGDHAGLVASLRSSSLSVSAHDGRSNTHGDGHIMDPISGKPAKKCFDCIACAHPSAAIADAYTTALAVDSGLADQLHDHGCSIAMIPYASTHEQPEPIVRDRLGVFSYSPAFAQLSKTVQGPNT